MHMQQLTREKIALKLIITSFSSENDNFAGRLVELVGRRTRNSQVASSSPTLNTTAEIVSR